MKIQEIWSEKYKRLLWRRVWVALARAQMKAGVVSVVQLKDIEDHMEQVDIDVSLETEKTTRHDLMAEIQVFAGQAHVGGGILHLGATSADIEENADALRIKLSLDEVMDKTARLQWVTHMKLPDLGSVLRIDLDALDTLRQNVKGKGFKGAVGTSASYVQLLEGSTFTAEQMEGWAMIELGLRAFPVTSQVAPRKQEFLVASTLANLGITLCVLAVELRELSEIALSYQRPRILQDQNMIMRYVDVLWSNASHSLLERTLDDSANRRLVVPDMFIRTCRSLDILLEAMTYYGRQM